MNTFSISEGGRNSPRPLFLLTWAWFRDLLIALMLLTDVVGLTIELPNVNAVSRYGQAMSLLGASTLNVNLEPVSDQKKSLFHCQLPKAYQRKTANSIH